MVYSRTTTKLTQLTTPAPPPFPFRQVLWRFKYEKYKAMKGRNGNCTGCRLPKVRFAYRAICDDCAKKTKRCPG